MVRSLRDAPDSIAMSSFSSSLVRRDILDGGGVLGYLRQSLRFRQLMSATMSRSNA